MIYYNLVFHDTNTHWNGPLCTDRSLCAAIVQIWEYSKGLACAVEATTEIPPWQVVYHGWLRFEDDFDHVWPR